MDTLDESTRQTSELPKQRHGCVTAWLVLMIVINSLVALVYLFASDLIAKNLPHGISTPMIAALTVLGLANVIFSILLLRWKKWGFWGFLITSVAAVGINLNIGLGVAQSLFGLAGLAILYGILQIKKNDQTTWQNLE